jgi:hypothetical protein
VKEHEMDTMHPDVMLDEDQPLEFLANNCELRSFFLYFRKRPDCTGIRWSVAPGAVVAAHQVIGELVFITGTPVEIVAPIDAVVVRTFHPNVSDLPHRPSQPIALFQARAV